MQYESREKDGELQAYDYDSLTWTNECPNCGHIGFDEEDYFDEDEDYFDDEY
jgi:hypothetical protein